MKAAKSETRTPREATSASRNFITPDVNIYETKDGYVLEAEMPGVNKNTLEITLEGGELTILGRRKLDIPNAEVLLRESSEADFRRVFELDPEIDTAKITAQIEQGLLTVHLPKAERAKPRRIEVTD